VHLTEVRKDRDIVLVDQRGTGRSSPLDCAAFASEDTPEATLALDPLPKAKACAAELLARGVDPAQYTTAAFIADLEAVRAALGYRRINLWGGSYGTRVALEYMRRHPQRIRSAVLDGVAPPGMNIVLDVWPARQAALSALLAACRSAPSCDAAHPDLEASLEAIARNLGPAGREVEYGDPATGERRRTHLTNDHVLAALQGVLYVPELASLAPEAIDRATAGDYAPMAALATVVTTGVARQMSVALHYSVACTEDAPHHPDPCRRGVGSAARRALAGGCSRCTRLYAAGKAVPGATPVVSDIPTLLLSGGLDPVTPAANGAEMARTLTRSRHVVAAGYGHIVSAHACGPRLIAAFVDHPDFSRLPSACVGHFEGSVRPMLWPDALGPRP
jgi:pimeloyl-ACP methyl ester carboxylesterase